MADGVVLDRSSINLVSEVAAAIHKLDEFFGLCASLFPQSKALRLEIGMESVWITIVNNGCFWYGVDSETHSPMGGSPPWRSVALDGFFGAFDIQDASENCVAPLAAIAQLEDEIKRAGGVATPYQKAQVSERVYSINQWLGLKTEALKKSSERLKYFVTDYVQWVHDNLQKELDRYAVPTVDVNEERKASEALLTNLGHRLIQLTENLNQPSDTLALAWATMVDLVANVAEKLNGATDREIGTVLQSLNVAASLKEWPLLCEMAQRYRPGPPPPIPPPPPSFER